MAKAPNLWKYGGQRVVGEQSTQRTRKLCTRGFFFSCMLAKWNQTRVKSCGCHRKGNRCFMAAPWRVTKGAAPDAVKAARPVLNGGMRKRTHRQRALSLPNPAARRA